MDRRVHDELVPRISLGHMPLPSSRAGPRTEDRPFCALPVNVRSPATPAAFDTCAAGIAGPSTGMRCRHRMPHGHVWKQPEFSARRGGKDVK